MVDTSDVCPTPDCERPRCAPHDCPAPGAAGPCECCGLCARNCADIAELIETHSPLVYFDRMGARMTITYEEGLDGSE